MFTSVLQYNKEMQINTSGGQTNFKWNKTTHLEMTMLALQNSSIDDITKRQVARYAQMPDFAKTELGYHNNTHFFFPNSKKKSFGPDSDKLNAFSQFKEHLQQAMLSEAKEEVLKKLGYALHYLQDMSVPLHTEPGGLIHKILKYKLHGNFERGKKYGATAHLDILTQNFKAEDLEYSSILDLFTKTAEYSQNPEFKVKRFNKKNWISIQQACFNRGVNASREFLEKVLAVKNIN